MKEFIDKLISRLEEKKDNCEHNQKVFENKHSLRLATICEAKAEVYKDAISIVNELAEECAKTPTPSHPIPIDTQQYIEQLESRAKATVELTDREREVLNTNLSAEIMKMQYHYGNNVPERLQVLYSLRDKLCRKEDKK